MGKKTGEAPSAKQEKNTGEKADSQVTIASVTAKATVMVAIIGLIGTLISQLFDFGPFLSLFATTTPTLIRINSPMADDTPTKTPAFVFSEPTNTFTSPPTESPSFTVTATEIPPATWTVTPTPPVGMDVQLITDITSGSSPLTVNFDARGSFLRDANGMIYKCGGGPCNYTWYVYKDGNLAYQSDRGGNGTFKYKFGRSGDYRVIVRVCRGQADSDCAYDGEGISVR